MSKADIIDFVDCKFTIESTKGVGGDFQRNEGGMQERKRITFEGFATAELYLSLVDAVGKVVSA